MKTCKYDKDHGDVRARKAGQIVQCLKRFFSDKPYYLPYPDPKDPGKLCQEIPQHVLIDPTNIDIVVGFFDFSEAMAVANYEVARHRESGKRFAFSGYLTSKKEEAMYLGLVNEFRKLEIPYVYQGGITLLYLWLCEGVEFAEEHQGV